MSAAEEANMLETGETREVLGELFRRVNHQDIAVAQLRAGQESLEKKMDSIGDSIKAFGEQIHKGTDWPLIWTAMGVVLAFIAGMGTLVTVPMHDRLTRLEAFEVRAIEDGKTIAMLQERSEWTRLATVGR
jgi:hypothetical protein